jgi:hypothetical protein
MKLRIRFFVPYIVGALALAVVSAGGLPMPIRAMAQTTPRTLVAVLAHPDDEGPAGPVLARYAREGVKVHLIVGQQRRPGRWSQP